MNFELDPQTDLEALAHEELTNSEVRVLLERLGMKDVGPANPTVGAVAEVCGVSTMVVGRMLAEIRQANLHELYGRTLESHGEKIKRLDHSVERILNLTGLHRHIRKNTDDDQAASDMATIGLLVLMFLTVFGLLAYGLTRPGNQLSDPAWIEHVREVPTTEVHNGDIRSVDDEESASVRTAQGERPPTKDEQALAAEMVIGPGPLRRSPPPSR